MREILLSQQRQNSRISYTVKYMSGAEQGGGLIHVNQITFAPSR